MLIRTLKHTAIVMAAMAFPALGQDASPRGAVQVMAGGLKKYLDEPMDFAAGGSVRVNLARRFALGPEVMVSRGSKFDQWAVVPNFTFDLRDPRERVTPCVTGGVGYLHELDKSIHYKRGDLTWNGGIGARLRLGGRLYAAPEFRLVDLAPRVSVGLGYEF